MWLILWSLGTCSLCGENNSHFSLPPEHFSTISLKIPRRVLIHDWWCAAAADERKQRQFENVQKKFCSANDFLRKERLTSSYHSKNHSDFLVVTFLLSHSAAKYRHAYKTIFTFLSNTVHSISLNNCVFTQHYIPALHELGESHFLQSNLVKIPPFLQNQSFAIK